MVKLLHVITDLDVGGAERSIYGLLSGGLAARMDCHVVSMTDEGSFGPKIAALGVPVHSLGMRVGRPSFKSMTKLRRVVQAIRPDIIQGWMYHGNLAAWAACMFSPSRPALAWNIRHSLHELAREKFRSQLSIRGNGLLSKRPDVIIYNSCLSRTQHERFGLQGSRSCVIPNGFDTSLWRPEATARDRMRAALKIGEDERVVGMVSRYHPMKDITSFLRAILPIMQADAKLHCIIAGREICLDNPALTEDLVRLPQDRVHLLGQRDDLPEILPAFDILCLSSAWGEGFPNVIGEAMACGVPCVATDIGDTRLVLGGIGRIVSPSDPQAFSAALAGMLALPPPALRALGEQARDRIVERFSLTQTVEAYSVLYRNLLE